MTDDQQALEVGRIILKLKAKQREIICLKSRATGFAEKLEAATKALRAGYGRVPVEVYPDHPEGPEIDHEAHWITAKAINELIEQIENATKEINSLKQASESI